MKRFNKILQLRRHTKLKRFSRSATSVVLAVCLLISCMTVGLIATDAAKVTGEKVGATIPAGGKIYLDTGSLSDWVGNDFYLSLTTSTADFGSYKPTDDDTWIHMDHVRGNLYSATFSSQTTVNKVSFWNKNLSSYNDIWECNASIEQTYDGTNNKFTFTGTSWNEDRKSNDISGSWSVYDPDDYIFSCPSTVIDGTDIMFYIQGYAGLNKLGNSSKTVSQGDFTQADGSDTSYVKVAKSTAGDYQYITNNPGGWEGKQNTQIGSSSAGKLHVANDATSTTAAKTATTTLSSTSITTGTASITLSTTCNSTTGVYNSLPLYYQYYLDDTYVASSEKAAKTTAQSFTLNTSSLTAGSHTVKTILTDGNIFYIANTETITVTNAVVPSIDTFTIDGASSATLNIGETATLDSTKSNSSNSVTYEVTEGSDVISLSGTTVKALKPGSATITASLTGATSKTVSVTVNTPTVSYSYDTADILLGKTSVAPTVSVSNKNSGSTVTYAYSLSDSTYATINATSGVITAKNTESALTPSAQNASVTATVSYNGVTYTTAAETTTYSVYGYYLLGFDNWTTSDAKLFKYDTSRSVWTVSQALTAKTYTYNTGSGYKVVKSLNGTKTYYGNNGTMTRSNDNQDWSLSSNDNNIGITADVEGTYVFDLTLDSSNAPSNVKVHYPHTITFDKNGKTTTAFPSDITGITYNTTATAPSTTPAASGYTFGGWYKENDCTNLFDFSTEVITADTTVYAKWTRNSHSINYTTGTGFRYSNNSTTSAHYQDTVSFTVTAESGYRITGVKYTPLGGSAQNCNADSNNTYSFTMPDADVEISVTTVKTYTVTLIAGEGIDTKKYRKGTSGDYTDYSQTITVDTGTTVQLKVSYLTGYEYDGNNSTLAGATTSDHLTFTLSNITSNKSVTIAAKKTDYQLTGVTSPENHGTITFYKDNNGSITNETIETANYQQYFWAVYTPADGYRLKVFSIGGGGASLISTSGNSARFKMGSAAATVTATVVLQYSVTYYIDMHKNTVSSLSISITDSNGTELKNANDQNCTASTSADPPTVSKVNSKTTVYSATIDTPLTQVGSGYSALNIRITYNGTNYNKSLASNQVSALVGMSNKEIWFEAVNESSQPLNIQYSTTFSPESGSTPAVPTGYRRIYLAKPKGWEDSEPNWKNIKVYHWGNYDDMGWNNGVSMNHLGYGRMPGAADEDTAQYHFYYVDLPKYVNQDRTLNTDGTGSKVQNIIFQGWADNATSPSVQTGNIEEIPESADFFILSKDGNSYVGTKSDEDVVIPTYARHASFVKMNVGETTTVNITPVYTGAKIVYSSSDTTKVTVNETTGVINPVSSTINESGTDVPVTITVKVYGSIGAKISDTANGGGDPHNGADAVIYTVSVSVHNTSKFNGFNIMAIESQTYTVSVPQIGSDQPGYFDMTRNGSVITVTGLLGVDSSIDSAIINPITDNPTSFTVKYAKANNTFSGYSDIEIIGTIVTKSNHNTTTGKRYGLKQWKLSDDSDPNYTISRKVANGTGIETATTTGVIFSSASATYRAIFEEYQYVDVTFTFNYDEYKPKKVDADGNVVSDNADGMIQYPYDATWADENNTNGNYSNSHNTKTFVVQDYEVRYRPENGETFEVNLRNAAAIALGVEPNNNYYDYNIPDTVTATTPSNYKAASTINLIQSVKQYKVYVNGDQTKDNNNNPLTYTYQEYAEPTVENASNWYAVDERTATNTSNAPLLATNVKSYKFRVKGSANSNNTYLRTTAATNAHGNEFIRSEVDFSHNEITHREKTVNNTTTTVEYLLQNFYIADFFSPSEVLDPNSYSGKGKLGPAYKTETVTESTSTSSENITIYFTDSLDWNDIHVYYWGENINNINWPGSDMTQSGTDEDDKKIYSAEIPGTAKGVIFTGNNNQTVDITNNIANGSHWKSKNETAQNGIPYDDAQFVGGGVVYYSVTNGTPFANAVSAGYVDGTNGTANATAVKDMLKANIEAQFDTDIAGVVGDEEAMKIAYGTEIAAKKNVEGGFNTGIIYRYLPLNQYKRDGNGKLIADGEGKYTYDVNSNTFRYSNSLQSYQYIYASGNENKATNSGKNMRLYSYYIYSYVAYNQETNVPETRYEVVLSDNYADASTYWAGNPNPNPNS